MLEFIEKEKLRIEEILKNDEEHQNKKVDYILYNLETMKISTVQDSYVDVNNIIFFDKTQKVENDKL